MEGGGVDGGGDGWGFALQSVRVPANGSAGMNTHTETHTDTHRRAIVWVGVRPSAVMGPGVDVVDRLTDRPVAMTICYLGGSRSISVTLSIVPSSNLSVHLRVFFPSLIGSSSSTRHSPSFFFFFFLLHHLLQTRIFSLCKCLSVFLFFFPAQHHRGNKKLQCVLDVLHQQTWPWLVILIPNTTNQKYQTCWRHRK